MISWSWVCQVALDTIGPSARHRRHKVSYKQAPNYLAVLERWRWHICLLHLIPPQEHGIYQPSIDPSYLRALFTIHRSFLAQSLTHYHSILPKSSAHISAALPKSFNTEFSPTCFLDPKCGHIQNVLPHLSIGHMPHLRVKILQ